MRSIQFWIFCLIKNCYSIVFHIVWQYIEQCWQKVRLILITQFLSFLNLNTPTESPVYRYMTKRNESLTRIAINFDAKPQWRQVSYNWKCAYTAAAWTSRVPTPEMQSQLQWAGKQTKPETLLQSASKSQVFLVCSPAGMSLSARAETTPWWRVWSPRWASQAMSGTHQHPESRLSPSETHKHMPCIKCELTKATH